VKDEEEVVKLPIGRAGGENPAGRSLGGIVDEILARREGRKSVVEWVGSCNCKALLNVRCVLRSLFGFHLLG